MSTSGGGGTAFDATVEINGVRPRTPQQQAYLDEVAEQAERSVEHAVATIAELEASLPERRAEAERARAEANSGRVSEGI